MEIVKFEKEHLAKVARQAVQMDMAPLIDDPSYAESLALQPHSFSAIDGDKVYACGGIIERWYGVAEAWMVIAGDMRGMFIPLHRGVSRFLDSCGYHRIEMSVAVGFDEGCRWAKMLGFNYEGKAVAYTPDGYDCYKYARVTL